MKYYNHYSKSKLLTSFFLTSNYYHCAVVQFNGETIMSATVTSNLSNGRLVLSEYAAGGLPVVRRDPKIPGASRF